MPERHVKDVPRRFLTTEYIESAKQRIKARTVIDENGCHNCDLCPSGKGYSSVSFARLMWRGHRLLWELEVGDIPEGMTLDHLCRNPSCVNLDHLEVVSPIENILRAHGLTTGGPGVPFTRRDGFCVNGHDITGLDARDTYGRCRECKRAYFKTREFKERRNAKLRAVRRTKTQLMAIH